MPPVGKMPHQSMVLKNALAGNIVLVCPLRQKLNLVVSENAVSMYKSAI
jgi:hypothetical protein